MIPGRDAPARDEDGRPITQGRWEAVLVQLEEACSAERALRAELRRHVIDDEYAGGDDQPQTGWTCRLCGEVWGLSGEIHEDGCLLASKTPLTVRDAP